MSIVLVTGSNQGLGYALLERLGKETEGGKLIMGARNEERGKTAIKKLNDGGITNVELIVLDITNNDSIIAAAKLVESKYGRLDILVNNAAIAEDPNAKDTRALINNIINTNVSSLAMVCEVFQPLLFKSKNPICINVSSSLGSLTFTTTSTLPMSMLYAAYSASKSALNQYSTFLAINWKDKVKVLIADPGYCNTSMNHFTGPNPPSEGVDVMMACINDKTIWKSGQFLAMDKGKIRVVAW